MATPTTISWDYVPGSSGTKVEYKLHSSPTWITPSSPTNPTALNTYPITVADDVYYDVRLTTICSGSSPKAITLQIIHPSTECCPAGYTLSMDGSYCFVTTITAATPPSDQQVTVASPSTNYGVYGSLIYAPGYNVNGTGAFTQISTSNLFWINNPINTTNGPNNRAALWSAVTSDNQDVGFTVCVNLPEDGEYYVAGMGDNYISIIVDGNPVVIMDPTAMGAFLGINGFPGIGDFSTFRLWHIYPVPLTAGHHVIEMIGHNVSSIAGMGAEIYNATSSQIAAATSYADLGARLIFSTKDYIGMDVQIGTGGGGYTCPAGYSLVLCDGPAYCTQTITTPLIPCP